MNRQLVIFRLLGVCVLCRVVYSVQFRCFDICFCFSFVLCIRQLHASGRERKEKCESATRTYTQTHTHSRVASEAKYSLCMTRDIKKCEFYWKYSNKNNNTRITYAHVLPCRVSCRVVPRRTELRFYFVYKMYTLCIKLCKRSVHAQCDCMKWQKTWSLLSGCCYLKSHLLYMWELQIVDENSTLS